jgi:hypothetical protein
MIVDDAGGEMKKAESERPRQSAPQSSAYPSSQGGLLDPMAWLGPTGALWSESLKWMEFWQRELQRMWGVGPTMLALRGARRDGDMRRASDLPWLPRLEAQVIPLRRNTDPPGREATRFSMRMPLPWSGAGGNVVAVETIVGAPDVGGAEQRAGVPGREAGPAESTEGS